MIDTWWQGWTRVGVEEDLERGTETGREMNRDTQRERWWGPSERGTQTERKEVWTELNM